MSKSEIIMVEIIDWSSELAMYNAFITDYGDSYVHDKVNETWRVEDPV